MTRKTGPQKWVGDAGAAMGLLSAFKVPVAPLEAPVIARVHRCEDDAPEAKTKEGIMRRKATEERHLAVLMVLNRKKAWMTSEEVWEGAKEYQRSQVVASLTTLLGEEKIKRAGRGSATMWGCLECKDEDINPDPALPPPPKVTKRPSAEELSEQAAQITRAAATSAHKRKRARNVNVAPIDASSVTAQLQTMLQGDNQAGCDYDYAIDQHGVVAIADKQDHDFVLKLRPVDLEEFVAFLQNTQMLWKRSAAGSGTAPA
jgi:hypothetical protein